MLSPLRIVIVEDELLLRSMLRLFCESEKTWHVVGEAGDCKSACSVVEALRPDIVLLDLNLGGEDGLDCLAHFLDLGVNRVLVLTGDSNPATHSRALEAGASTVLLKGDPAEKILNVIRGQATLIAAEKKKAWALSLENTHADRSTPHNEIDLQATLNVRERLVIELLAAGYKDDEIAHKLNLCSSQIQDTLTSIYRKLGVADRVELVVYAFQHQLAVPQNE